MSEGEKPRDQFEKIPKVIDRLAAYEDTGLEPEICLEYKTFEDEAVSKGVPFKRIVELMEVDKDGRLVIIPEPSDGLERDLLEPMKVGYALKSEVTKLNTRLARDPKSVSHLDYTIIAALQAVLEGDTK